MSSGTTVLDCSTQPPRDRVAYWEDGVQRLIACRVRTQPLEHGRPLESALEKCDLGELSLLSIRGSAQRAQLHPPSGFRGLMVMTPHADGGWLDDDEPSPLRAGHAYLLDPQRPWALNLPLSFEHHVLLLPAEAAAQGRAYLAGQSRAAMPLQGVGVLFARMLDSTFAHAHALTVHTVQTVARTLVDLFDAVIADAGRSSAQSTARLAAYHRRLIREYALAKLQDPDLDVRSVAQAVQLSVRHVHHLFSMEGDSLMHWIWAQRLERSRMQLERSAGTGARISDVAYAWGFRDPNHFSRAFRQAYGVAPSAVARGVRRVPES